MLRMVSYFRRSQSGQIMCYLNRTYHVLLTSGGSGIDSFAKRCDCIDSIERIGNLGFKNGSFCQSVVVFDPDSAVAGRTVSGTDSAGTYYSGTRSTRNQRMM